MEQKEAEKKVTDLKNGEIDTEKIEKLSKELEQLKEDNKKKVYGLPVKNETTKKIFSDFIEFDVEWKYMEAFGIPKILKALQKEIKNGQIYLNGIEIEALSFYLMKANGKGAESAQKFLKMKDIVDAAYNLRIADNRKENAMEQNLAALEQGINVCGAEKEESEETSEPEETAK